MDRSTASLEKNPSKLEQRVEVSGRSYAGKTELQRSATSIEEMIKIGKVRRQRKMV